MSKVFLTGATGFVGSHVLRALRTGGYDVRALVRSGGPERSGHGDSSEIDEGVEYVQGDLLESGALVRALDGCRYVVHCAALYSFAPHARPLMHRVNVLGTTGLLEAARIAGVERAVVTSSTGVLHARERHASAYHRSKVEQERAALAARVPTVLVLPSAPVGPHDVKPTPTGKLLLDFARGKIRVAPPRGGMNVVAVEDVAHAHVAALERGRGRERYIVGGENLTFDQIWSMLAEITGRPNPRVRVPYAVMLAAGWCDELRCRYVQRDAEPFVPLEGVRMSRDRMFTDGASARQELGLGAPSSVHGAMERAIQWYRARGYA